MVYWPSWGHTEPSMLASLSLDGAPFFARLVDDLAGLRMSAAFGGHWSRVAAVQTDDGRSVAIWADDRGSLVLPFDPGEAMSNFWSESYQREAQTSVRGGLKRVALRGYYSVRPALPRSVQISMRRMLGRVQRRRSFPRWPIEPALHDLYDVLFRYVAAVAGEPVPSIAPWPKPYTWAMVLTHDVETSAGYERLDLLRDIEIGANRRSSWNFVPKRYEIDDAVVRGLIEQGFEVGVHGLFHDGRDLESEAMLKRRLPEMRAYAERWGASGFRSPATHRRWDLMPMLGFDYDSSYPDTDPFEPQAGGSCSWLPYFNQGLVELPITLVQDHTLFVILGERSERVWIEKTTYLRSRGGMALLITHPDYMLDSTHLGAYARFLESYDGDNGAWQPLPREVSAWWRRRAASTIVTHDGQRRVEGPAHPEADIRFVGEK